MKKIIFCALLALIASCKNQSPHTPFNAADGTLPPAEARELKAETPEEVAYWTVENLAAAVRDERLEAAYPELTVKEDEWIFGEGTTQRKVKILNSGTDDEILISYDNGAPFEIHFGKLGRWRTKHPIYIGLPIEELNKINEKPVAFAGFGWDYSGLVGFQDGAINKEHYSIFVAPNYKNFNEKDAYEFMGSGFFDSNNPNVEKLYLYVSSITYKF